MRGILLPADGGDLMDTHARVASTVVVLTALMILAKDASATEPVAAQAQPSAPQSASVTPAPSADTSPQAMIG